MDYQILHAGVDTLDIAFKGAFPVETIEMLEAVRKDAEGQDRELPVKLGPGNVRMMVKSHGQRGGFRFVLTDSPCGAIYSVKASPDPQEWNLFVSVRALRLLTAGYEGTKDWLARTLKDAGFRTVEISVNRIDYALDILAPDFELDAANFICTGRPKVRSHWSKEQILDDDGNVPRSVLRGRSFESVTIGSMPGRQVIVYDKRRAAIDQQHPYWFDAWGIERDDPGQRVWRVELRAGRDALTKLLAKQAIGRPFAAVEQHIRAFLIRASEQVRYTAPQGPQANISRVPPHLLWNTVQSALQDLPVLQAAALPEASVLEGIRRQRAEMAEKQAFGNLINQLVLEGLADADIADNFEDHAKKRALNYLGTLDGDRLRVKLEKARYRAEILFMCQ